MKNDQFMMEISRKIRLFVIIIIELSISSNHRKILISIIVKKLKSKLITSLFFKFSYHQLHKFENEFYINSIITKTKKQDPMELIWETQKYQQSKKLTL